MLRILSGDPPEPDEQSSRSQLDVKQAAPEFIGTQTSQSINQIWFVLMHCGIYLDLHHN